MAFNELKVKGSSEKYVVNDDFTNKMKRRMRISLVPFFIGVVMIIIGYNKNLAEYGLQIPILVIGIFVAVIGFGFWARFGRDMRVYTMVKYHEEREAKRAAEAAANPQPVQPKPAVRKVRTMADRAAAASKLQDYQSGESDEEATFTTK